MHIIGTWIERLAQSLVRRMARQFPVVLVTGARQSGKTSLLRRLYPDASYLILDLPAHAEAARTAPDALLEKYPAPVIIDEVQYAPSLLRYLKVRIDADRSPAGMSMSSRTFTWAATRSCTSARTLTSGSRPTSRPASSVTSATSCASPTCRSSIASSARAPCALRRFSIARTSRATPGSRRTPPASGSACCRLRRSSP